MPYLETIAPLRAPRYIDHRTKDPNRLESRRSVLDSEPTATLQGRSAPKPAVKKELGSSNPGRKHMCTCIYIYIYMRICIHVYMHACMCICRLRTHVYIYIYIYVQTHAYIDV